MIKNQICNRIGCNKEIEGEGIITSVGIFCSEECRKEIEKKLIKLFIDFPINL
jgi:hypothetical protein